MSAFDIQNTGYDDQLVADCSSLPFTEICLPHITDPADRAACTANLNSPQCDDSFSMPVASDLIMTVERDRDADDNPVPNTGAVVAREICSTIDSSGAGTNCFDPLAISGADIGTFPTTVGAMGAPFANTRYAPATTPVLITSADPLHPTGSAGDPDVTGGGNFRCPSDEIMVGIREGQIICSNISEFDCPPGEVFRGINSSGELVCDSFVPTCPATTVTNSCGETGVALPEKPAGTHEMVYSGECYMLDTFNPATAATFTNLTDLRAYTDSLNAGARTAIDCHLVRDRFECPGAQHDPVPSRTRQKFNYTSAALSTSNFGNSTANTDARPRLRPNGANTAMVPSSITHPEFNSGTPMSVDPNNNSDNHDCWCREDYRAVDGGACASGAGIRLAVQKKRCPQTRHNNSAWYTVWNSGSSLCACTAGDTFTGTRSCAAELGIGSDRVDGDVLITYQVTNCAPYTTTPISVDYSACTCPTNTDQVPQTTTDCSEGFTNSFSHDGENYTNKSFVRHRRWECPTVTGNLDTVAEAGRWVNIETTQACNCVGDSSSRDEACPPSKTGVRRIETYLNCSASPSPAYEDVTPLNVIQDCQSCSWTQPDTGSAQISTGNPGGSFEGSTCHCGDDTTDICKYKDGPLWYYWNDCECK